MSLLTHSVTNYSDEKASVEERFMTKATIELIKANGLEGRVLSLGLGNGAVVKALAGDCECIEVVEADSVLIENFYAGNKMSSVISHHCFFEEFEPIDQYDFVLANHVLEHVVDPAHILSKIKGWLKSDGVMYASVPNAKSLHRQIGVQLGMLDTIYDLNESDRRAGHRRVYDRQSLERDLKQANFAIRELGGYNLKLVSLAQMQDWSDNLLDAIYEVSKRVPPDLCSNLWAVCSIKTQDS